MNIEQLSQCVADYSDNRNNIFQADIDAILMQQEKIHKVIVNLQKNLPTLANSLIKEFGLEISNIEFGDQVHIQAKPMDNRFKFIKDTGYTENGAPRNRRHTSGRAEKMRTALQKVLSGFSVDINPYSLEEDAHNRENMSFVLITLTPY